MLIEAGLSSAAVVTPRTSQYRPPLGSQNLRASKSSPKSKPKTADDAGAYHAQPHGIRAQSACGDCKVAQGDACRSNGDRPQWKSIARIAMHAAEP
jgi:hypothetical protein